MQRLHPGDAFPAITAATVGGGTISLPNDLSTPYGILVAYRAHW